MCKYIGTVRFFIAQLIYNKREIRQKCLHRSKEFSFTSKCSGRSDLIKVCCSLIKVEVEQSLSCRPHFSPWSHKINLQKLKKVLKSLCYHYTVQKLLHDQCTVNFLEVLKVYWEGLGRRYSNITRARRSRVLNEKNPTGLGNIKK